MNLYRIEVQFLQRGILLGTEVYEVEAASQRAARDAVLGQVASSHYNSHPDVAYHLNILKVDHG